MSWEERFTLDVDYVERRSFTLDLSIIGRTVVAVVRRQGINGAGEATMSEFVGARAAPELGVGAGAGS